MPTSLQNAIKLQDVGFGGSCLYEIASRNSFHVERDTLQSVTVPARNCPQGFPFLGFRVAIFILLDREPNLN